MFPGDADGDAGDVVGDDDDGDAEEIMRVDKEIENKARVTVTYTWYTFEKTRIRKKKSCLFGVRSLFCFKISQQEKSVVSSNISSKQSLQAV